MALQRGLPNAKRPDSQGLCFLGPLEIPDMLQRELSLVPGEVLNELSEVIGRHTGAASYTLGQRHGFTIAASEPHFVIAKDVEHNTITVSPDKFPTGVSRTEIELQNSNWIGTVADGEYMVRYRYKQELISAKKIADTIVLAEPHYVPEGQVLVLYQHERCLGGGIVSKATLQ